MSAERSVTRSEGQTLKLVGSSILMRLTVDTAMRMMYPYLPEISRGLGITLSQGGLLVSLRSAMLLTSPVFGAWSDRHGSRRLLSAALLLQAFSLWWLSVAQGLWSAVPPVILLGLSASAFIPTLQATISDHVPYQRRGRVLAVVEFSWALTGLIIIPLVGLLMVQMGWQAPFRLFAVLTLLVAPLPLAFPRSSRQGTRIRQGFRQLAGLVWRSTSARAAIAVNGLMFIAAEGFFVTYGAWLERSFGLAPDEIGRIAGLLGLAELLASALSSLFIDRVGKRRGVGAGLLAMTLSILCQPWLDASLALATAGMFAFTVSFEFTIVSNIGLMSEQVPKARGTVLSLGVMAGAATRALTGVGGVLLFEWRGMPATALVAAAGSALAFWILLRWIREAGEA